MKFTHIYSNATKELRPIADAPTAIRDASFCGKGFKLVDMDSAKFDVDGNLTRGWSYCHIQYGWICAGAGDLNSLRVIPLS